MVDIISIFLLSLAVIVHPCTAAPNLAAMTWLWARAEKKTATLWLFLLGHSLFYGVVATVLTLLLRKGVVSLADDSGMEWTSQLLAVILAIGGIAMIWSAFGDHHHHHLSNRLRLVANPYGAFVCGLVLAAMFCPEAALAYFGMLVPLSVISPVGLFLPWVFAIGTAAPLTAVLLFLRRGKAIPAHLSGASSRRFNLLLGVAFLVAALCVVLF